ncbi:PREDICTED: uncharacterized protein LOC109184853 [Ipomoea nil]|uniref:uncharacterized protein LOC109184853 n=1 Tax=Ipomoea nil TaxID=35883 RepID=UPI000900E371|nr:PREDICTED: uncharacterized protein LOC109184853 [Ipomoea nil]XP_019190460.1 PREDICTED: uncharacterized protein LOC109184853 [Ipomoea nil]XP_019190461.1 PREDICTED: uncharacterized protein LOC109184853 [Ipomoea nil]
MNSAEELLRQFNASRKAAPRQMNSAEEALRHFNAGKQAVQQRAVEVPREAADDPLAALKARLERFAEQTPPPIPAENLLLYNDVPDILDHLEKEKTDFRDDQFLESEGFYLFKTDLGTLAELGRTVLPMLARGFDTKGVIGLFLLAYNLRIPYTGGEGQVFEDIAPDFSFFDAYGPYVANVQYSGHHFDNGYKATLDPIKEAIYFCFIAASTLRLFIKPVDNYIGAWQNIISKFITFYGFPAPLVLMAPTKEALAGLHCAFAYDERMKMTLYKILYSSKRERELDGLRRFLYETHLVNTGLHAVGIFAQLSVTLNVRSSKILQALHTGEFAKQTNALAEMVRMMTSKEPAYARRMWRFGRIFNENFMSSLRTKACPRFVYILASMLKREDPAKCGNILHIVPLSSLSEDIKLRCQAVAKMLLNQIRNPVTLPIQQIEDDSVPKGVEPDYERDLKELGKCCETVADAITNLERNITEVSKKYPDSPQVNRYKEMATILMGHSSLTQKANQLKAMAANDTCG